MNASDDPQNTGAQNDRAGRTFPIVGVGASAGGLQAFKTLLEHLPDDPGGAFILVQHLSPEHESNLAELLQPATGMTVQQAQEGQRVAPGGVYIIPPGKNLGIEGGVLHLTEQERERFRRAPIDHFFRALAEDQHERAIGVVLSGMGAGGTEGLKRIKERGGLALAQNPDEAEYDAMPRNAIGTDLVDFVLPLQGLAEWLVQLNQRAFWERLPRRDEELSDNDADALRKVFAQLRSKTGHDFSSYKRSTMLRRISRRMQVCGIEALPDYLDALREDADEAEALFRELLISVTNFFRDPEAFEQLEETVIPQLFEPGEPSRELRVWVPGCATGEEAYSLLILLQEEADRQGEILSVQVFGSDLDDDALDTAREGLYPEAIQADVSEERLRRFFSKEPGGYRVKKDLRERVLFARHSLLKDPPFFKQDLISCRNLLIYLDREMQQRVFRLFHYALRPGGYLFLGTSESADGASERFATVDKKHRLYQWREAQNTGEPALPTFPLVSGDAEEERALARTESGASAQRSFDEMHRALLHEHAPASIIIDEHYSVMHLSERAGAYLRLGSGPPTSDLLDIVPAALRLPLRTALFQAFQKREASTKERIEMEIDGRTRLVTLRVRPIRAEGFEDGYVQVLFEERAPAPTRAASADAVAAGEEAESVIHHLEEELERTRTELRSTVEEYETSNEELKASNEELQSMNEELKSTAEELETSKEELQSTNEEIMAVNQELKNKNEELDRANSDLQNLLVSTDIGTLFLDRELRIQRFTPRIADLFNIQATDRGRPVTDLTRRIRYDGLAEDARRVLKRLETVEREIQTEDNRWYLVRLLPYRTVEDKIDGVVVTFVEFTRRKEAEEALREARQYAEAIVNTVREPLVVLTPDLRVNSANDAFYETFEVSPEQTEGRKIYNLGNDQWNIPALRKLLEEVLPESRAFSDFEVTHTFEQIGRRTMLLNARQLEHMRLILLAIEDVTERKKAKEALRRSEERYRLLIESVEEYAIFMIDTEGRIATWNVGAERLFGYTEAEAVGLPVAIIFTEEDRMAGAPDDEMTAAAENGQSSDDRWHVRKGGERFWASGVMTALYEPDGSGLRGFAKIMRDNTRRKQAEDKLQRLNETLEERVTARTQELQDAVDQLQKEVEEHQWTEEALRQSRERFQQIFRLGPFAVALLTLEEGRFLEVNDSFLETVGYAREEVVGRTKQELDLLAGPITWRQFKRIIASQESIRSRELTLHTKEGISRTVLASAEVVPGDDEPLLLVSFLDATERKKLEQEVLDVAEREQRRIGRELHDELGQRLVGAHYLARTLRRKLAEAGSDLVSEADDIADQIDDVLDYARDLSHLLVPSEIEDSGLEEALIQLAANTKRMAGISVSVEVEDPLPLRDASAATHLYRIVQEAVTNAVRHAEPDRITIRLFTNDEGAPVLRIEDDGTGIAPGALESTDGLGLRTMRYRADLIGCALNVCPGKERGTVVDCTFPLPPAD